MNDEQFVQAVGLLSTENSFARIQTPVLLSFAFKVRGILASEHSPAMEFYGVESIDALIEAQAEHVERLQAKIPKDNSPFYRRVPREG